MFTACVKHGRCCLQAASSVLYTTNSKQSSAPEDGRNYRPKHVELIEIINRITRVVPKVMSNHFLHANREKQTKESTVVDGTSCCVILECLLMSVACIM